MIEFAMTNPLTSAVTVVALALLTVCALVGIVERATAPARIRAEADLIRAESERIRMKTMTYERDRTPDD